MQSKVKNRKSAQRSVVHRDLPRYPIVRQYERELKQSYAKILGTALAEFVSKLKD